MGTELHAVLFPRDVGFYIAHLPVGPRTDKAIGIRGLDWVRSAHAPDDSRRIVAIPKDGVRTSERYDELRELLEEVMEPFHPELIGYCATDSDNVTRIDLGASGYQVSSTQAAIVMFRLDWVASAIAARRPGRVKGIIQLRHIPRLSPAEVGIRLLRTVFSKGVIVE